MFLELEVVSCRVVAGIDPRISGRTASTLNH